MASDEAIGAAKNYWREVIGVEPTHDADLADDVLQMAAFIDQSVAAAVEAERERCANLIESFAGRYPEDVFPTAGTSVDAISGRMARHVARVWAQEIRESARTKPGERSGK